MLEFDPNPLARSQPRRSLEAARRGQSDDHSVEARVKPDCVHLYPGVDPKIWYKVIQEGEYRDEMEGLWIEVSEWVTYVLAKHFDLQSRTATH
ncbi:MAG TPA: hypothetical protein VFZ87_13625 [Gemmatimonadales bacterium]